MVNVGPLEIALVAIIALIVLGPARLPDAARSLGRGMREFRSALSSGAEDEDHDEDEEPDEDGEEPEDEVELPPLPREPPAPGTPEDLPEGR
jgi:sec-independent protein translocase protein TatA